VRQRVLSYFVLLILLLISKFVPTLSTAVYFFMALPLLFLSEEKFGLRNWKKGLLWGSLFFPLLVIFPPVGYGKEWFLNQFAVAFIEEVFFRAYLMSAFGNLVTSLLFAGAHLVHFPSLNSLLVFFPSLIFGYSYLKSGSILAPFLLHLSANLFYRSFTENFPEFYHFLNR
jgi:membrane protease YdiL (CAAX protease family)